MDTNKMRDPVREQFEDWHKSEIAAFVAAGEIDAARHMEQFKQTMLAIWQASRAAVMVDLPFLFPHYRQGVKEAIEAHGCKVAEFKVTR